MAASSMEHRRNVPSTPETAPSIVKQPGAKNQVLVLKANGASDAMQSLLDEIGQVSESSQIGPSEQWSASGNGSSVSNRSAGGQSMQSREEVLSSLPPAPKMQKALQREIRREIRSLQKEAKRITRIKEPGSAYRLSMLFARIRDLRLLMDRVVEASYDTLKKIFVRVFVDKQQLL